MSNVITKPKILKIMKLLSIVLFVLLGSSNGLQAQADYSSPRKLLIAEKTAVINELIAYRTKFKLAKGEKKFTLNPLLFKE